MTSSSSDINVHFFGWKRIKEKLEKQSFYNKIRIIDYLDHYHRLTEVITEPWCGFIHHTCSTFSKNNIDELFKNKNIIDSLESCKFLVTFSEYNRLNINKILRKLNSRVRVFMIKHPMPEYGSENNKRTFSMKAFNKKNNVATIGGWMRNPYTIYRKYFSYNTPDIFLEKLRIRGINMDNYFDDNINYNSLVYYEKDDKLLEKVRKDFDDTVKENDKDYRKILRNIKVDAETERDYKDIMQELDTVQLGNRIEFDELKDKVEYIKMRRILEHKLRDFNYSSPNGDEIGYFAEYALKYIRELKKQGMGNEDILEKVLDNNESVKIIEYMDNREYLKFLTSTIIFNDYVDCAASNTILECVSTATPIILNRHPSIVEYLGIKYPLYFDELENRNDNNIMSITTTKLNSAHTYLLKLRTDIELSLDFFIDSVETLVNRFTRSKLRQTRAKPKSTVTMKKEQPDNEVNLQNQVADEGGQGDQGDQGDQETDNIIDNDIA